MTTTTEVGSVKPLAARASLRADVSTASSRRMNGAGPCPSGRPALFEVSPSADTRQLLQGRRETSKKTLRPRSLDEQYAFNGHQKRDRRCRTRSRVSETTRRGQSETR